MDVIKKIRNTAIETRNYYCIMFEGLFNVLGNDIIGMTTIVPLFLADYGAYLGMIGALPTAHGIIGALTPLIAGGFIQAAKSKRRLSLGFNGAARSSMLLIPFMLLIGFSKELIVGSFFAVVLLYYVCQSITGISWNYLLGVCVWPERRGKLMGTLLAMSGVLSFLSSNIVRLLRESDKLSMDGRYASIFGLGGVLMAMSVLFFIPLKETVPEDAERKRIHLKEYLSRLIACIKNVFFRRLITAQAFSNTSTAINSFLYIFAQNILGLETKWISYMIIIQTVGVIFGGVITGRISEHFGSKRTLILVESLGITIPILELCALQFGNGEIFMITATFVMGFSRSGFMAYQSHLLEIAEKESIYFLVSKSMLLLPFTFVSVFVGMYIENFSIRPVFFLQIATAAAAIFSASRLKLFLYAKNRKAAAK